MRLIAGSHCFVMGSMAAFLYAGAASPDREYQPLSLDAGTALTHSDAARAGPDPTAALPDVRSALGKPVVAPAEPEVAKSPQASDGCAMAEDCIDQYLWSIYERTLKEDTIKLQGRSR